MLEDQELINRLRNGSPEVLRQIYHRHKDDLLTVAACIVGDRSAAEDCLHDVIVSLAGNAAGTRLRGSLRSYLVASVANRARDELRRRLRRNGRGLSLVTPDEEPTDGGPGPLANASLHEQQAQLYQALTGLPPEQRIVITLRLHGDLTFEEIAEQEGVSGNTVRSRYRYGIDKLRSYFGIEVSA